MFKNIFFILCLLFLTQCSTKSSQTKYPLFNKSEIQQGTPLSIKISIIDEDHLRSEMQRFKKILLKKKPLSAADWQLHDDLLRSYIQLKFYPQKGLLKVPAKTRLSLTLKSYCLDPRRANPDRGEVYSWRKAENKDPFLREILRLSPKGKYSQKTLQGILWNLNNKTLWEDYPENEQEILKQIDPAAALKLPSKTKQEMQNKIIEQIEDKIPDSIKETVKLVEGQYNSYENFKSSIESKESEQSLPANKIGAVEGTDLFVENQSDGFEDQEVTFYNPSDADQVIDLNTFYQDPFRRDVQPLASYFGLNFNPTLFADLEKLLFDDMMRLGLSYSPVLGDLIDLYEASTGRNFFTNEWLTNHERFMAAMGVLAGSGESYRYAEKVLRGPASYIDDVEKKYRKIRNTESYKELESLAKKVEAKGIPDDWRVKVSKPSKEKQGIEYVHPENEHTKIRVMPGKADHPHKNSKVTYVKVQNNGDFFDKHGKPTIVEEDQHIPLIDFNISNFPWIKK